MIQKLCITFKKISEATNINMKYKYFINKFLCLEISLKNTYTIMKIYTKLLFLFILEIKI